MSNETNLILTGSELNLFFHSCLNYFSEAFRAASIISLISESNVQEGSHPKIFFARDALP